MSGFLEMENKEGGEAGAVQGKSTEQSNTNTVIQLNPIRSKIAGTQK